jgi:hypothetical protein
MLPRCSHRNLGATAFLLVFLFACGGGGETPNTTVASGPNQVPTVAITSPTKAVTTESGYSIEFHASASDKDIGDVIDHFEWDFGDTTPLATVKASNDPTGKIVHAFTGTPGTSKTFNVSVKAYDNRQGVSPAAKITVTIPANAGPKASIVAPDPKSTLKIGPSESYTFRANLDQASLLSGLSLKSFVWNFGDGSAAQVVNVLSNTADGAVNHAFPSNGTYNVTVAAVNDLNNVGQSSAVAAVSVAPGNVNQTPVITITNPAGSTSAYTTKPVPLAFTLQDGNGDAISYIVNWGDGATNSQVVTSTLAGRSVSLTHAYADSLTATSTDRVIQVTAQDNRSSNGIAAPQSRNISITHNNLPTATILTPQASGTLPNSAESGGQGTPVLPPVAGSSDPDIVVIPMGGKLSFKGSGTPPSSGGSVTYQWTFNGGSTQSSITADAGEITFAGQSGRIIAYLVELVVKDQYLRSSANAVKARQKWVIVDGLNTQDFNLNFLYRQKAQNSEADSVALVNKAANGLNAKVQILQDGIVNTHAVTSATGAALSIPVRSNLPFYVQIPSFGVDSNTYLVRIPNKPGVDPALETLVTGTSFGLQPGFGFESATAPWNPTFNVVTAEGFSTESEVPYQRNFVGTCNLDGGPNTVRWIDRLSVPAPDSPRGAYTQWVQKNNLIGNYNPIVGLQNFSEWLVTLKTTPMPDPLPSGTAPTGAEDLKFTLDLPKFTTGNAPVTPKPDANPPSASFSAGAIEVFRAPKGVTNPYNVDSSGATGTSTALLDATTVDSGVRIFYNNMLYAPVGTTSLQGGLQDVPVSYVATDPDRTPKEAIHYNLDTGYRTAFSYNEYLWSKVWARPLALNRASVGWYDLWHSGLINYPYFRFSDRTTGWPKLSTIAGLEGGLPSSFDFHVSAGNAFDPTKSPALDGAGTPNSTGIGRFYWTAFAPIYDAGMGAVVSRTWLADEASAQPPTVFPNASPTQDPTPALGFLPPLDPVVDYRGRNATGGLTGDDSGGYRVSWYNATRNAAGAVVPPDFWVVVLETASSRQHFLLPANFPSVQAVDSPMVTDARQFLPSQSSSYSAGDKVGTGYCWFDVPVELRPTQGVKGTLMVVAVRSVDKKAVHAYARPLNRNDWIASLKTNSADVQILPGTGIDISYAHRIPFSFPWDVVVANSVRYAIGQ